MVLIDIEFNILYFFANQWPNNLIIIHVNVANRYWLSKNIHKYFLSNDLDSLINITRPTIRSWNWSRCAREVWQHAGFSQLWKPVVVQVRSSKVARMLRFYVLLEGPGWGFFVTHDLRYIVDQHRPRCWSSYNSCQCFCHRFDIHPLVVSKVLAAEVWLRRCNHQTSSCMMHLARFWGKGKTVYYAPRPRP